MSKPKDTNITVTVNTDGVINDQNKNAKVYINSL